MARLLRNSRPQFRFLPDYAGNLPSSRHLYSSWLGGNRPKRFGFQSYHRSELSKLGDWACLGLTVLAGGVFLNSFSTSTEAISILESPGQLLFLYGALRYSLQRKALRVRLKWLRLKLVAREVELQELEREKEACMMILEDIIEGLEDGFLDKIQIPSEQVPNLSDDPFLSAALTLLLRIDKLRDLLREAPEEKVNGFPYSETGLSDADWIEEQLSRVELLVKRLVGFHAANEARISQNKDLRAKVDDLLFNLEKER